MLSCPDKLRFMKAVLRYCVQDAGHTLLSIAATQHRKSMAVVGLLTATSRTTASQIIVEFSKEVGMVQKALCLAPRPHLVHHPWIKHFARSRFVTNLGVMLSAIPTPFAILSLFVLQSLLIVSPLSAQEAAGYTAQGVTPSFPTVSEAISSFPTASMVTKADTAFVELARKYFTWRYSNDPVSATYIGLHEFDGRLDDLSPEAIKKQEETTAGFLKELSNLKPSELSKTHRYDYFILTDHLERDLFQMREIKTWEKSPLFYTEMAGGAIRSLLSREFAPLDVRLTNVVSRLHQFPRLVEQAKANIKSTPRINTETAIKQNAGCISYIEEDLKKTATSSPALAESVRVASEIAVKALKSFGTYLETDLLPRSNADYRIGKELYGRKLRFTLQADTDTDELVGTAWKRYEEVRKEAIGLSRKIHEDMVFEGRFKNHAHGEGAAADEDIAREVFSEIAKDHAVSDGLLDQCKQYCGELERFIREKDLITLPTDEKLEIEWTPEFERGVADGGLESPGPFDPKQAAFFYVAPVHQEWTEAEKESFLREYNDYLEQIFCIHEALPGHYVQGWYSNQFPSLVRAMLDSGPFVEGWAVYSEQMMLDAGYRGGDPKLQLSELKWLLRVIINAIIDPGLHTGTMTEKEATDLMIHGGFQEEREARGKIVRASLTSTQLPTYFVGVEAIRNIEKLYREKTGNKFNQKEFNEKLLSFGAPPLKYLKEMMLEE